VINAQKVETTLDCCCSQNSRLRLGGGSGARGPFIMGENYSSEYITAGARPDE
jgi:hypothetical protein